MVQGRGGAGLLQEAAAAVFVRGVFGRQEFERDDAVQLLVVRLEDRAHAARAQRLHDPVVRDGGGFGNHFHGRGSKQQSLV